MKKAELISILQDVKTQLLSIHMDCNSGNLSDVSYQEMVEIMYLIHNFYAIYEKLTNSTRDGKQNADI